MPWILNDPPPKFGAELAECQRYQLAVNRFVRIRAARIYPNFITFFLPTPVSMRGIIPTIIDAANIMTVYAIDGTKQSGFTFRSPIGSSSSGIIIDATKNEHGMQDAFLAFETSGNTVIFDENL